MQISCQWEARAGVGTKCTLFTGALVRPGIDLESIMEKTIASNSVNLATFPCLSLLYVVGTSRVQEE
jgi:hypothetical protein